MLPKLLIHIRHGETAWNVQRRLQGGRDIELNERGRAQARGNGPKLAAELVSLGLTPDRISWVASPLVRARETMETIRRTMGLDPQGYAIHDELREISYGIYEGMTHEEIAQASPSDYRQLIDDKWGFRPPKGENYFDLKARVGGFLERAPDPVVIVSHGGVLRIIRSIYENRTDQDIIEHIVPQDQLFVWSEEKGRWV
jgi:probable phosphoglycerate mutase